MADEYSTGGPIGNKRKYDGEDTSLPSPPPTQRRATGFSAPILSTDSGHAPPSYNSVAPPVDDIQLAKQRAQEIAARLFNSATGGEVKRPDSGADYDSGDRGYGSGPTDYEQRPVNPPSMAPSYGYQSSSKKIDIPNGRVGVIIGKGGETIKYLQLQSGAKIQITRDAEADRNCPTRPVELSGTAEQIAKAEQLINDVLNEAESGGSGTVSRRFTGQSGGEEFSLMVPNSKVGLVIGKGGETIKNMQARTGARIQVIPLRLPPGDTSTERLVKIEGTYDQIEQAKQLINEVTSDNRPRNQGMSGGYAQQGYQTQPSANWGQPGAPMQQNYGGYVQSGGYPGPSLQYSMPAYGGYPQHAAGGYPPSWDQSSMPTGQQPTHGTGYDYYGQQNPSQQLQPQGGPNAGDNGGYSYSQGSAVGYGQQGQGYSQPAYSGGYQAAPPHAQSEYDQQTQPGYSTAPAYGNATNPTQDSSTASQVTQVDVNHVPSSGQPSAGGQQGYNSTQQPSPKAGTYHQGTATQLGFGVPPSSQPAYGTQPPIQPAYGSPYGQSQGQKPTITTPAYGSQQSLGGQGGGYAHPGYQHPQPTTAQPGYSQTNSTSQKSPALGYGAPPATQPAYGTQQPLAYNNNTYGSNYSQPAPSYAAAGASNSGTGSNPASYNAAAPPSQTGGGGAASSKS